MARLGVLGWPVAHSRSPAMFAGAFAASGLDGWRYQLLPVAPELFAETAGALPAAGFLGANVTVPHKAAALALADAPSPAARAIGAANMLTFTGDSVEADNTDAPGLLAALPEPPAGRSALVLGAGGSARAVAWALREAGARRVAVWNRTPERARALAADLGVEAVGRPVAADLLVHCTSVGRGDSPETFKQLPVSADGLAEYACVVDLVYRDGPTELLAAAQARGATVVDGLEILVRQGALSFERWTGRPAPLEAMRSAARA
ncbi:MAG TPA: shikimate dehydrogenase [Solirubrobacteraceae bacterium]|jgi:shikimate dehydrogenase|nr:shikimate dehydrogenase [Solirubrobacteraceae bacterium]